jgi:hypothetical protein
MFVVCATLLPCLHCIRHALATTIFISGLADLFRFPVIETHGFVAVMKRTLHDFFFTVTASAKVQIALFSFTIVDKA